MKRFKFAVLAAAIMLAITGILVQPQVGDAAEVYRLSTTVHAEGDSYVIYKITGDMTTGTDAFHSHAIPIGDLNAEDGYIQLTLSNETGTEDVDVVYHYSYDNSTYVTATEDSDLNAATAGTVSDTLGIINGNNDLLFHSGGLLRIEFEGQTGNPNGTDITCYVYLHKDTKSDVKNNGIVRYP